MFEMLVPRVSYFPVVLEKVKKYFLSFVDASEVEDVWLEFEGFPLKWSPTPLLLSPSSQRNTPRHNPVGVLYDVLKRDEVLPWEIAVRLKVAGSCPLPRGPSPEPRLPQAFPEEDVIRLPSLDALGSIFLQSLKEADQLKHRGEVAFLSVSPNFLSPSLRRPCLKRG